MADRDYYEVLGVPRDASRKDIQAAYRRLAREHHPDVNPGDDTASDRIKEINEAYAVLADDERREHYDRFGTAEAPTGSPFGEGFMGMQDLIEAFFGGGGGGGPQPRRRSRARHGGDIQVEVQLTLQEALTGAPRELKFLRFVRCETCSGTGAKPGAGKQSCPMCHGVGQIRQQRNSVFGATVVTSTCPSCRGAGETIRERCAACRGDGRTGKQMEQKVDIPVGVEHGATLQVPGGGHDGLGGGRPGDLYVTVGVASHPRLHRRGTELATELEVTFTQLALGDTATVETLEGEEEVDIEPGTQPGAELVLRGQGMPALGSSQRGNLHVLLKLVVPADLSETQADLLREFERQMGGKESNRKKPRSYFDRFKDSLRGDS